MTKEKGELMWEGEADFNINLYVGENREDATKPTDGDEENLIEKN